MRSAIIGGILAVIASPCLSQDRDDLLKLTVDFRLFEGICKTSKSIDADMRSQACGVRDYIGYLLTDRFEVCLAQYDQATSEFQFHRCDVGSIRFSKPLIGD